jgi:hypothetical protein
MSDPLCRCKAFATAHPVQMHSTDIFTLINVQQYPPQSCKCRALETSHPGRMQHKLCCPIFRRLNPHLTVQAYMSSEGFPNSHRTAWPALKLKSSSARGVAL